MQELLKQWTVLKAQPRYYPQTVDSVYTRVSQELAVLEQLQKEGYTEIVGEPLDVPGLIRLHRRLLEELQVSDFSI